MDKMRFSAPRIEKLEFIKNSVYSTDNKEVAIDVDIQKSDAICLRDREFFYSINIIVSGEDAPFKVVLQISAIFDLSDVENAVFSNNIKEKGTHILTSFARPIIMDIVVKAGYPPLVIPYSDNE